MGEIEDAAPLALDAAVNERAPLALTGRAREPVNLGRLTPPRRRLASACITGGEQRRDNIAFTGERLRIYVFVGLN
jgi:hypothetical protein